MGMMNSIRALLVAIAAALACAAPAHAQFAAVQTYIATSGGTNAITVSIPNVTALADIKGVPLRVKVAGSNTAAATLQVNSLTATAINKPTTAGLLALNGGEVVANQINTFIYDGTVFELVSPSLFLGTVPAQSGFDMPVNMGMTCSASANALSCSMTAANISTGVAPQPPSALAPVYIPFRDPTIAFGDPVWRTITGGVTFTVSGGNTMGCSSALPCRLWITAIDNGGTILLGLSNQSTATQCYPLNEGALQTTGAGTGGGSAAGTIFTSSSAVSSKAIRIIGYVEWSNVGTAGNWITPTVVQLFGPGIKRPCEMVQSLATLTASSLPSLAISLTSAVNLVKMSASAVCSAPGSGSTTIINFRRGASILLSQPLNGSVTAITAIASATLFDQPVTTASTTYSLNNTGSSCIAVGNSSLVLDEIMGANDNEKAGLPAPAAVV